jgi:hypothetical protein
LPALQPRQRYLRQALEAVRLASWLAQLLLHLLQSLRAEPSRGWQRLLPQRRRWLLLPLLLLLLSWGRVIFI